MIGRGKQIVNVDWWLRFCTQVKFIVDGKSCANQLIQLALIPSTSIGLPYLGHSTSQVIVEKAVHFLTPKYPPKSSKDQEP